MPTRILIVDDHDIVRMGLVRLLQDVTGYEIVDHTGSGDEAIRRAAKYQPDVILMDVKMPGMGGLEATKKILAKFPKMRVIAVTSCEDDVHPERFIKAGAKGYVSKGASVEEIKKAINASAKGQAYMSSDIAQQVTLNRLCRKTDAANPFDLLSERELQTAMMICDGRKAPDIAESFCVSPKTVNSYRYRIFEKLNINSDVELALQAVRYNLLSLDLAS